VVIGVRRRAYAVEPRSSIGQGVIDTTVNLDDLVNDLTGREGSVDSTGQGRL